MSATVILAYAGAACAGVVALAALWRGRRSLSLWFFAAGMLLLAVESAFLGLAGDSVLYGDVARWQHARLAALSLMPGIWLLFSLSFARGNDREFLRQWTLALAAAFLVPVALACVLPRSMLFAAPIGMTPGPSNGFSSCGPLDFFFTASSSPPRSPC